MQIIVQSETGGPEVLRLVERPDPQPGAGEMLIRVAAAGVNPADAAVRTGALPLLGKPPFTVGWDIAGTVLALGAGVQGFALGDRVFGMPRFPAQAAAYATLAVAPAAEMAKTPEALGDAEAGALPLAGLTAWQALVDVAGLRAGQSVLIHSGAGGVGHLAVQIAVALGARVTATASPAKLDLVRSFGAEAVDYTAGPIPKPGEGYDVVLDPQSVTQAPLSVALTRPGGHLVALLPPPEAAVAAAAEKGVALTRHVVHPDAAALNHLAGLAQAGKLKVILARSFPLAEAGAAQAWLAEERPAGKLVLLP